MPKYNKDIKTPNKPYSRSKQHDGKFNSRVANDNMKKKSITKSERVKNADITSQLDNLMEDLSNHLTRSKKKPTKNNKDKALEEQKLDEQQRQYEQMQNDMDDALGLLNNL